MQTNVPNELLFAQGIDIVNCLYSNTEDSLYQGYFRDQPASILMQRIIPGCDENRMTEEMKVMRTLRYKQIVKLLDCFRLVTEVAEFLVVVTEFCAKTVEQDMIYRRRAGHFFTESELWTLSIELISAFAYMQRCGFAHRCISPASLYLTKDSLVVGNFSSSTVSPPSESLRSIHGQSYYHSPKIVTAILKGKLAVSHNIYMSDVYSLGLTLLALATLEVPERIAMTGHDSDAIREEVGECRYSDDFKQFLLAMLEVDEEKRGDFIDFELWTRNGSISRSAPVDPMKDDRNSQRQGETSVATAEITGDVEKQKAAESVEIEGIGERQKKVALNQERLPTYRPDPNSLSTTTKLPTFPQSSKRKRKSKACCSLL